MLSAGNRRFVAANVLSYRSFQIALTKQLKKTECCRASQEKCSHEFVALRLVLGAQETTQWLAAQVAEPVSAR